MYSIVNVTIRVLNYYYFRTGGEKTTRRTEVLEVTTELYRKSLTIVKPERQYVNCHVKIVLHVNNHHFGLMYSLLKEGL